MKKGIFFMIFSMVWNMRNILFVFGIILFLAGCSNVRYEDSININAPKELVFGILEDYENYPNIIPDFHDSVEIITENRTGFGVQFRNNSTFGGWKVESIFEVTEYRINEYIKLENKTHYGFTELIVEDIGNNGTKYTLINYTRIPNSMKNKLFEAFDNELEIIKKISEYNFNNN